MGEKQHCDLPSYQQHSCHSFSVLHTGLGQMTKRQGQAPVRECLSPALSQGNHGGTYPRLETGGLENKRKIKWIFEKKNLRGFCPTRGNVHMGGCCQHPASTTRGVSVSRALSREQKISSIVGCPAGQLSPCQPLAHPPSRMGQSIGRVKV